MRCGSASKCCVPFASLSGAALLRKMGGVHKYRYVIAPRAIVPILSSSLESMDDQSSSSSAETTSAAERVASVRHFLRSRPTRRCRFRHGILDLGLNVQSLAGSSRGALWSYPKSFRIRCHCKSLARCTFLCVCVRWSSLIHYLFRSREDCRIRVSSVNERCLNFQDMSQSL